MKDKKKTEGQEDYPLTEVPPSARKSLFSTSVVLLGIYVAILGYIAFKSGLNSVLMGRFSFGDYGSKWPDFVLGFTQIGWYAWGTATVAIVFTKPIL